MPTADYSSYHQPSGTGADGTKLDNFIDAVQATVNGLDNNNIVANAGIVASKLSAPYTAYTPTWTAPTPPAIGNGTISGTYIQIGKFVQAQIRIVMGSTTTYGTGQYSFSLPVTAQVAFFALGSGYIYDSSADSLTTAVTVLGSSTTVVVNVTGAAGAYKTGGSAAPFAWAVNDEINLTFTYGAA